MGSYVHACQTEMGSYVQPFSKVDGTICLWAILSGSRSFCNYVFRILLRVIQIE